ncbi:hypothetical protein [Bradyrhizobium sp. cf659]|uniref:hypothetical protein n=1 Tax=Bradyrhizobium sp. cf659 TaxID=1761771 RepID=UPI000B8A5AFC|nr:hypothetical protein [Bradyrhizobium sp. cf659]
MTICLNEYQRQFLRLFTSRGVRFLIIGGQGRAAHYGASTKDLDLWVDISHLNRPVLDLALVAWATEHPSHSASSFALPLPLRPAVQIKFPDAAAWYLGDDGEPREITPDEGIDILTSIGSADFAEFYDRAEWFHAAGLQLPVPSADDLAVVSPRKR